MHRALLTPKLVTQTIDSNRLDDGYLHTCLMIRVLLFHSTTRVMPPQATQPRISRLVQISLLIIYREQSYPNSIKSLRFGGNGTMENTVAFQ